MGYIEQKGMEYWSPKEADEVLEGVVIEEVNGEYGRQYVVEREDKTRITTPSHAYLQNRMKQVKSGDKVKLVYVGEEAPSIKGRSPTKIYKVFIDQ